MNHKTISVSLPWRRGIQCVCDAALLTLLLEAVLLCAVSVYGLEVNLPLLIKTAAAAGLGFGLLWALPWWRLPILLLLEVVWGRYIWRLWDDLCLGEVALRCKVVNTMAKKVSFISRIQPVTQLPPSLWRNYATLWIILVGLLFAGVVGCCLCRGRMVVPVIGLTILPLFPALCVTEAPAPLPTAFLLAGWGTLILRELSDRQDPVGSAIMTPSALTACALVLAILIHIMPLEGVTQPEWAATLREEAIHQVSHADFSRLISDWMGWTGAGSSEYISLAGNSPGYTGRTVLKIHTDAPGKHYLRGWSADVYTSRRWEPLSDQDKKTLDEIVSEREIHPLLELGEAERARKALWARLISSSSSHNASEEEGERCFMEIENVSAPGSCVYFPYGMTTVPEGAGLEESHLSRKSGVWENDIEFLPVKYGIFSQRLLFDVYNYYMIPLWEEETYSHAIADPYRNFVYAHECQVPDGLQEELAPWLNKSGFGENLEIAERYERLSRWSYVGNDIRYAETPHSRTNSYQTISGDVREQANWQINYALHAAEAVIEALADSTTYDKNTPAPPAGEDYTAWFLNKQKTGYCMHYATAATLLLRMMGVPTRYVSGYVVNVPTSGYVDVPDQQAHAWVEIWLDGLGWYPVEVTPGFGGDSIVSSGTVGGENQPRTSSSPTPAPKPSPSSTSVPSPTPEAVASVQPSSAPSQTPEQVPNGEEDREENGRGGWLIPALAVILLACLLWHFFRRRREQKLHGGETNAAVLYAMRCHCRLQRWGCVPNASLIALAEKAKFSPHMLTEEERTQALNLLTQDRERTLLAIPWWKRWIAKAFL